MIILSFQSRYLSIKLSKISLKIQIYLCSFIPACGTSIYQTSTKIRLCPKLRAKACITLQNEKEQALRLAPKMARLAGLEPAAYYLEGSCSIQLKKKKKNGAGDGNRTHATSLEGWNSTIELHPHTRLISGGFISISPVCENVKRFFYFSAGFNLTTFTASFYLHMLILDVYIDLALRLW